MKKFPLWVSGDRAPGGQLWAPCSVGRSTGHIPVEDVHAGHAMPQFLQSRFLEVAQQPRRAQ